MTQNIVLFITLALCVGISFAQVLPRDKFGMSTKKKWPSAQLPYTQFIGGQGINKRFHKRGAYANLNSGGKGVFGVISFVTVDNTVYIRGSIGGLKDGAHGIHIHSSGNVGNNCKNIGDHYNPFNKNHTCDAATGHFGDLGNVFSINGVANVYNQVAGMTLAQSNGKEGNKNPGVGGLSIAVDMNPDNCQAAKDGNSGPVIGCGQIMVLPN